MNPPVPGPEADPPHFPINRVVAFLTPLVFAPLAGVISVWAAKHLPGTSLDTDTSQALIIQGSIFVVGAVGALLKGWKFLTGWQKYEDRAYNGGLALQKEYAREAARSADHIIGDSPVDEADNSGIPSFPAATIEADSDLPDVPPTEVERGTDTPPTKL